jgi:hypothetical protein
MVGIFGTVPFGRNPVLTIWQDTLFLKNLAGTPGGWYFFVCIFGSVPFRGDL